MGVELELLGIVILAVQLMTLALLTASYRAVNEKMHFLTRMVSHVERYVRDQMKEGVALVTSNSKAMKAELSVSLLDTESAIMKRLSHVVPDLEEFLQRERMAFINPVCHYDYLVPTGLLTQIIDRNRMSVVAQEREYLAELKRDIMDNGLREPLVVTYDDRGQMMLQEGHHRLRVVGEYPYLPVVLKKVPKSAGTFNPSSVENLFKAFAKEQYAPPR